MNISHLKYFNDSVELGSLKKAAERNFVTPGAISQAIKKLESHFNLLLIHHSKNSLLITEHGIELMKLLPAFLISVENIELHMKELNDPFCGKLRLATQQSLAVNLLTPVFTSFNLKYPRVELALDLGHSTYIKKLLDQNSIDFALSMDNLDYGRHSKEEVASGRFVLLYKPIIGTKVREEFLLTGDTFETRSFQEIYRKKIWKITFYQDEN